VWHWSAAGHVTGLPFVQLPDWHVSPVVHAFPSLQDVPLETAVCDTPVTGSHASAVHGFPSSTTSGVPGVHVPPWQVSAPSHTVPFGHGVPSILLLGAEHTPVLVLHVPAVWH
jgi:hypothetical protein